MDRPEIDKSKAAVYDEIRQRIARVHGDGPSQRPGRMRGLVPSPLGRIAGYFGSHLATSLLLAVAALFTILLAGGAFVLVYHSASTDDQVVEIASLRDEQANDVGRNTLQAASADARTETRSVEVPTALPEPRPSRVLRAQAADSVSAREPADPPQHGFLVQVGSFSDPANAERLANRLSERWATVSISLNSNGHRAVRIGPFTVRAEAEMVAADVGRTMDLTPYVTRTEQ